MVETHDWVRLPVRVMIIELAKNRVMRETGSDFAMRANRIRRSLDLVSPLCQLSPLIV